MNQLITNKSKVRIYWEDKPENYSRDNKIKIRDDFHKKYNIDKQNIDVRYVAVIHNENGEPIKIDQLKIENIKNKSYQRELFKKQIENEGINVDLEEIFRLDDIVNEEIKNDEEILINKKYKLKYLECSNFLSLGDDNYLDYNKLNGVVMINSIPPNRGGKTNFSIQSLKFLFFGKTDSTDTTEEIFNRYSEKNKVVVKGILEIDSNDYSIIRTLTRVPKKKGGYTVTSKLEYKIVMPDGTEEDLKEEDSIRTTKKIVDTIGTLEDFNITVLATANNLEDLLSLGKAKTSLMMNKFIGIDILEKKQLIAKKKYGDFVKKMKSNHYNSSDLENEIKEHKLSIDNNKKSLISSKERVDFLIEEIKNTNIKRDDLLKLKRDVDVKLTTMNPSALETELRKIVESGKLNTKKIEEINLELEKMGPIDFNEGRYLEVNRDIATYSSNVEYKKKDIIRLKSSIEDLKKSTICITCERPLEGVNVDNKIEEIKKEINDIEEEITSIEKKINSLNEELVILNTTKINFDKKNKQELVRDKLEIDNKDLRVEYRLKNDDLTKYKNNLEVIEFNKKIDVDLSLIDSNLNSYRIEKDSLLIKIENNKNSIKNDQDKISEKTKIIEIIKIEGLQEFQHKTYIGLLGKKGISKILLRSILPIINSELSRLMSDVCDFELELEINSKNDINMYIINDGVRGIVKSTSGYEGTICAIALRTVLSKISSLPVPNFVAFDEILGKVADSNLDKVKMLIDKIKDMYDIIFMITHKEIVKDWCDSTITIVKENNLSKLITS